jgi:hypothetical protein
MAKEKEVVVAPKVVAKTPVTVPNYDWAFNKLKLKQAYAALLEAKRSDPSLVIDEGAVKEAYIARAGLLSEDQKEVATRKRPRSTSNLDKLG